MPVTTKIPPPMMAPTLMATALQSPIERLSFLGSCGFAVDMANQIQAFFLLKPCKRCWLIVLFGEQPVPWGELKEACPHNYEGQSR